jgi:segregation and condensation protein A
LWNAFNLVLRRLAEKMVVGEIRDEQVTVADQMEYLLEKVSTEPRFVFSSLFTGRITVRLLVATFLAVLELVRMGRLHVQQDEAFADIVCEARENPQKPLESPVDPATVTA